VAEVEQIIAAELYAAGGRVGKAQQHSAGGRFAAA
jgi:hypothetical protein